MQMNKQTKKKQHSIPHIVTIGYYNFPVLKIPYVGKGKKLKMLDNLVLKYLKFHFNGKNYFLNKLKIVITLKLMRES